MCLLSLYGCGTLIHSVYIKWDKEPVVVTFGEKPVPVFTIPFPAVTICPETKVRKKDLDFTTAYQLYNDEELWQYMAKEQWVSLTRNNHWFLVYLASFAYSTTELTS